MATVNLDALIPREDFEILGNSISQQLVNTLTAGGLIKGEFFYSALRKPDFQRETADWDKNKIKDFISSFIDGDLIPSIILWNAGQYTFVIDGAHRLSALIAWVNDDYGDGFISQSFFSHEIDPEQKLIAEQTRRLVNKEIGSYKGFIDSVQNPSEANQEKLSKAQKLGFLSVHLQWVQGDAEKAENSFFKINEKSTPISETEKSLLKARKKAFAMASRAIMRSGTGHKYWAQFSQKNRDEIVKIAKEINESLFTPEQKNPIKTLDLPLAGKNYSSRTLALIFDLVKLSNDILKDEDTIDTDGTLTIRYLRKVNKIIRRFTTTHASSLGLHPAVYFYSEKGRYQPTAFLAWIEIIKSFEKTRSFIEYTDARSLFEEYVIKRKNITNQVTLKYGSALKGYKQLKDVYLYILDEIKKGNKSVESIDSLLSNKFSYLNLSDFGEETKSDKFSTNEKSKVYLKDAIANAPKCKICQGLVHVNSISIDHVTRKQDGGLGVASNGQLTHPFCNTTYKN